jgi:hypothetical protein
MYSIVGMNRANRLKGNWVIRVNGQSVRLKDVFVEVRLGNFLTDFFTFGHLVILVVVIQSRTIFRDSFLSTTCYQKITPSHLVDFF